MSGIRQRTFVWRFDSPLEKIWPILADTARLNEAAGFPKHEIDEVVQGDGSVAFNALARIGPFALAWDDRPQNWVTARWFEHHRYPRNGPIEYLGARMEIAPDGPGCKVHFTVSAAAANWLGAAMLGTVFFSGAERTYARLARQASDYAAGRTEREFEVTPARLAPGVPAKVASLVAAIEATDYGHGLAARLADYVTTRPEVDCVTIRPLRLARLWNVPDRLAVELCLQAARLGLLGSRWDLLCPRCQVGKASVPSLGEMPTGTHCPSCNISYERDFAKNVELAFYPSRAIRPIDTREYCLFGPMSTPQIKAQLTVAPGTRVSEPIELAPGTYRLRTLEPGGEHVVDWPGGGFPALVADGAAISAGPPAAPGTLVCDNRTDRARTFILEEYAWRRDVLTAHRASTMQAFRALFDDDVLRPGDNVEIDTVTLMFTDFKGSTALYERIGDARAYHLIREFFHVLGAAVRAHDGTIVKTVGDAVNAAFALPADALACAVRIQADVERFNAASNEEPITVTIGLHAGRCIAVTLNGQLDYYGTAANKAARLEGESLGGDIVLSEELCAEPTLAPLLAAHDPLPGTARLKGFDAPVPYRRITAEELAAKRKR